VVKRGKSIVKWVVLLHFNRSLFYVLNKALSKQKSYFEFGIGWKAFSSSTKIREKPVAFFQQNDIDIKYIRRIIERYIYYFF
jgi:hypothetical protein